MKSERPLRQTKARRVIWEELYGVTTHPTAEEVYEKVKKRLPRVSLGTVYRNLELLSQTGKIRKIEGGPQKRFDPNTENHYHFRCRECGRVSDLTLEPVVEIDRAVAQLTGGSFDGYHLEVIGLCPSCRASANRPLREGSKRRT
jgi:Fur family ferric uptake transcriptional regulator